jgi:hypothetical protein
VTDFDEIWYECYAVEGHPKLIHDMHDGVTCEVGATVATLQEPSRRST